MDVVGGVIVAADRATADERSAGVVGGGLRSRKRGRCGAGAGFDDGVVGARGARVRRGDAGARDAGEMVLGVGVGMGIAASAWGDEPWSYCHRTGRTKAGDTDDYALRNMPDNFYRPVSAAAGGNPGAAGFVAAKPVRAWVDPLRFLLKKELTTTDVGDLGRIILPKRDAECQLPHLDNKEGKLLSMEDYNSNKKWTLRYKWWPNNKSRMYVLESTGEFVKHYNLKEKDELSIYRDGMGNLVIRGQKWSSSPLKTTDSFLFKAATPTGKRSPKGAANNCPNLSKPATAPSSSSTLVTSMFPSTTSVAQSTSLLSSTSVLSTSLFTSYGATNPDQQNQPSNEIASIDVGPLPTGSYTAQSDGASIDWAKLPDPGAIEFTEPPAIEFSDSPAIEFPADFEYAWSDMLSGGV